MSQASSSSETLPEPRGIVEALLFVGGPPLSAERAGEIIRNLGAEQLRQIVDGLNRDYRRQGRPYAIQTRDEGYVLSLRSAFRGVRERLAGSPREARLTTTARDVLAIVAYRQPITKADIDSQRGTDSRGQLHQLVRLGLVAVVPQAELGQGDAVYVTTARFLELVGLDSLDDLPRTGDLQRL
jgi:segregation and condensation protein B